MGEFMSRKLLRQATVVFAALLSGSSVLAQVCSAPGKDGITPISGNVNSYFPGTTALTSVNDVTIGIGSVQPTTGTALAAGDLAIVMQMQGVDYNSSDTNQYGDGLGDGTVQNNFGDPARGYLTSNVLAGSYEYVRVASVTINSVTFTTGLVNTYAANAASAATPTTQGRRVYQVIRVPQLSSVTIDNSAPIRAFAWDGVLGVGGVLAVDIAGTLNFSGAAGAPHIDATGRGFRGGGNITNSDDRNPGAQEYRIAGANNGGFKGDGIAGTPSTTYNNETNTIFTSTNSYLQGDRARGAPGNAGGGGNSHNSAGGGGGNGGRGGNGGNTFSGDNGPVGVPATGIAAPGEYPGAAIGTKAGREFGGWGGAAFAQRAPTKLVMGGGGGAGALNNASQPSGSGGSGGGILIVRAGRVASAGLIRSNGTPGIDPNDNRDPGGGGGAGGSVVVIVGNAASASNVSVQANGGKGGDSNVGQTGEAEGPGGGGGGGVIASNFTLSSTQVNAGIRGTAFTTFAGAGVPDINATDGVAGVVLPTTDIPVGSPAVTGAGFNCLPTITVAKSTSTATRLTSDTTGTYSITVSNAVGRGDAVGVAVSDVLPTPFTFTGTTAAVVFAGGATFANGATTPATIATGTGSTPTVPVFGNAGSTGLTSFLIPGGGSVTLTFPVQLNNAVPSSTAYQNPANTSYQDPTRTAVTTIVSPGGTYQGITPATPVPGSNYASASSTNEDITISPVVPTVAKAFNSTVIGNGQTSVLTITLTNTNPTVATLAQNLVDNFPANVILASPTVANTTCGGAAALTTTATSVTLPATRTIPANGTCTITVNVTSNTAGQYTNTIPAGSSVGGLSTTFVGVTGNQNAPSTAAPLTVIEPAKTVRLLTDADGSGTPTTNDTVQYQIIYSLPAGTNTVPAFQAFDVLPPQVSYVANSLAVTPSAGTPAQTGAANNPGYTGLATTATSAALLNAPVTLQAGGILTVTINALINNTAVAGTPFDNTARATGTNLAAITGNGTGGGVPSDADATPFGAPPSALPQPNDTATTGQATQVTPAIPPQISVTKSAGTPIALTALSFRIPYTVRVANTGGAALNNAQANDILGLGANTPYNGASSVTVSSAPSVVNANGATCQANAGYTGQGANTALLSTTIASTLPNFGGTASTCTITFTVDVVYPNAAAIPTAPN